jgi:squalene-hopene/tetraprenyl-beta-curcumene cyclase
MMGIITMLDVHDIGAPAAARAAAVRFLLGAQSPDGAWRSDTYGVFKGGDALTPLVLGTLLSCGGEEAGAAVRKGVAYLTAMVQDDGPHGLSYPVYTAALAVRVLSHPTQAAHRRARDAWLAFLRGRQLTEERGWQPSDREYGGWGFSAGVPIKPRPGEPSSPLTESNLSATVLALEALRAAGCPDDDPAFARALVFVRRCQNYADDPARREPFDDGGFFFIYADPVRNKAGVAGRDASGRERFASYGSMTADGLRCLLACGLADDDGRVMAARRWLEDHFTAATNPGRFPADRRSVQAATYFYYAWSVTRALSGRDFGRLAEELARRQRPDGSWANEAVEVREDDPIVATALAAGALAGCRRIVTED